MARLAWRSAGILALAGLAPASAAGAAETVALSANIGVVSDYRYRGISLSDRKPALQGGLDATIGESWFIGGWASTIEEYAGADLELDVYAGRSGTVAGLSYSLGAYGYLYPGGKRVNYVELQASAGHDFGPIALETELALVPEQWNSDTTNFYAGAKLSMPVNSDGLSVLARGGRENGYYKDKIDWEIGLSLEKDWLTASASLVGTNYSRGEEAGKDGKTGLVFGIIAAF